MKLQYKIFLMVLAGASSGTLLLAQDAPKPAQSRSIVTTSASSVEQISDRLKATSGGSATQVAEIAKMSDAGVDEKSILAYIDSLPQARVRADDIIYLHDKGISSTIINTWLQHANSAAAAQAVIAAQAPAQNAPVVQAPATPPAGSTPVYVTAPEAPPAYVNSPTVVYTEPSPYYYPYYYPGYCGGPYVSLGFYSRPYFSLGFRSGFYPHHFGGGHAFVGGHGFVGGRTFSHVGGGFHHFR